jgi:dihydroorotate dehydrogenase electron transfer subunit
MYNLAKKLISEGKDVKVILGFNTADEVFYEKEFESLGAKVFVATADGSVGTKGFVTDVMKDLDYSYFYTCGPMPMFLAIEKIAKTSGQYSFEERMGCGFGACVGCSCKTKYGNKKICVDGPVLVREEIVW